MCDRDRASTLFLRLSMLGCDVSDRALLCERCVKKQRHASKRTLPSSSIRPMRRPESHCLIHALRSGTELICCAHARSMRQAHDGRTGQRRDARVRSFALHDAHAIAAICYGRHFFERPRLHAPPRSRVRWSPVIVSSRVMNERSNGSIKVG